jgi:hypothetical protein
MLLLILIYIINLNDTTLQHVTTLKGSSSESTVDTFQQQDRQIESPEVNFISGGI